MIRSVLVVALISAGCSNTETTMPALLLDGGPAETDHLDSGVPNSDSGVMPPWAPWPPVTGDAGLQISWTINGSSPTQASCDAVGLSQLELVLVHPVVVSDTWTDPKLKADCPAGEIRLEPSLGLAPGRYRFKVVRWREDQSTFAQTPSGETTLKAGQVTHMATIDIVQAIPASSL